MAHVKFDAKKIDGTWIVDMDADDLSVLEPSVLFGQLAAQSAVEFSSGAASFNEANQEMVRGFFAGASSVHKTAGVVD